MAASALQHRIGASADGPTGIGRCEQQSDCRPYRQIIEIISYKGRLCIAHPQLVLPGVESDWLVLDSNDAVDDAQLPSASLRSTSLATTQKGDVKPFLKQ